LNISAGAVGRSPHIVTEFNCLQLKNEQLSMLVTLGGIVIAVRLHPANAHDLIFATPEGMIAVPLLPDGQQINSVFFLS